MMFCCTVYAFFLGPGECEIHHLQITYYTEMYTDYPQYSSRTYTWNSDKKMMEQIWCVVDDNGVPR